MDCAAEAGIVIACKHKHEEEAQKLSGLQARAGRAGSMLPFFTSFMGMLFVVWGLLSQPFSLFTVLLGGAFVVVGVVLFLKPRS